MKLKQQFIPAPGKIALIVEGVQEHYVKDDKVDIIKPDDVRDIQKSVNPWALVVGVGEPRLLDSGRKLHTNVEVGDRVAFGMVGRYLPLVAVDGHVEYIYCVPFEGIIGHIEVRCEACGYVSKQNIDNLECPKCPKIETVPLVIVQ